MSKDRFRVEPPAAENGVASPSLTDAVRPIAATDPVARKPDASSAGRRRTSPAGGAPGIQIEGRVSPGFEPVRDAFVENFARRHELGGACCVYHRGEKVVDLWGGVRHATTGEPWAS